MSLSSSAAAPFTFLTLNAAGFYIPFSRIKCHPKAWCSAEEEEATSERRKAFAVTHRAYEDRQAYISTSRRALSVIAGARVEWRGLALLSRPNLALGLCALSFVLSLAFLPPLPASPAVPLQGSWLHSSPEVALPGFARPHALEGSHSSFCSPFSPAKFLATASNLSLSTATGPYKVAYAML